MAVLGCTACGGGSSSPSAATSGQETSPSLTELENLLDAEFTRLGIDPEKVPATVASGDEAAVFDLALTVIDPDGEGGDPPTGVELTWTERMAADYNQDGLVSVSDLTPIGQHFRESVAYDASAAHDGFDAWPTGDPDDGGTGADNWRLARIDGNSDGLIEVSDITPLALHWNEFMSGYVIERAVNQGTGQLVYDADWMDIGYGSTPSVPRSVNYLAGQQAVDPNLPVRYSVTVPLEYAETAQYFRVRPYDAGTDEAGWESNRVVYVPSTTADTTPPIWDERVGITDLIPGPNILTVDFDDAYDLQSPPVTYRVYWAEGDPENPEDPFDYTSASYHDVTAAIYTITGLTDGQYYRVAVRAMDSADPPNIELNEVVLGREAGATDIYPPEWQGRTGIADLFYGNGQALVVFDKAVDSHTDIYGTWENGPAIYRICYGLGETPDWDNAEYIDYTDAGRDSYVFPIDGLDTSQTMWFGVRVMDQAQVVNEDGNRWFKVGTGAVLTETDYPEPGPGVPDTWRTYSHGFIYSPDHSISRLLLVHRTNTDENWYSTWNLEGHEFAHDMDGLIASEADAPNFRLYHASLTNSGELVLIYQSISTMAGVTFHLFTESDGQTQDFTCDDCSLELAGVNVDGNPWVLLYASVNDDIFNPEYEVYFSWLPISALTAFWASPEAGEDYILGSKKSYSCLANGSVAIALSKHWLYDPVEDYIVTFDQDSFSQVLYVPEDPSTTLEDILGFGTTSPIQYETYYVDEIDRWGSVSDASTSIVAGNRDPIYIDFLGDPSATTMDNLAFVTFNHTYDYLDEYDTEYSLMILETFGQDKPLAIPFHHSSPSITYKAYSYLLPGDLLVLEKGDSLPNPPTKSLVIVEL